MSSEGCVASYWSETHVLWVICRFILQLIWWTLHITLLERLITTPSIQLLVWWRKLRTSIVFIKGTWLCTLKSVQVSQIVSKTAVRGISLYSHASSKEGRCWWCVVWSSRVRSWTIGHQKAVRASPSLWTFLQPLFTMPTNHSVWLFDCGW